MIYESIKIKGEWQHPIAIIGPLRLVVAGSMTPYPKGAEVPREVLDAAGYWTDTRKPAAAAPALAANQKHGARYLDEAIGLVMTPVVDITAAEIDAETEAAKLATREIMSVSRMAGQLYLLEQGLLDTVLEAIAAIDDPLQRKQVQIGFDSASTYDRLHPLTLMIQQILCWTDDQMDLMFSEA